MVPWRRRAHHSKRAGGRGAGGSCRRHRDPVPPFSDPALAAPAGSVGISAAVVVATWRAAMLDDPRIDQLEPDRFRRRKRAFCVCAHQPRIAGDISGQERRQPPLDPLSAQCSLPPPLTLGSRRWHKLNSAPRAETDQRRSRQARAARRPQLPHALRRAEWPLLGRRQSAAGQAMKGRSGSKADDRAPRRNPATVQHVDHAPNSPGSGNKLHPFRHRIAEHDSRAPTSAGLSVDQVASVGCGPHPATDMALCPAQGSRRARRRTAGFIVIDWTF